MRLFSLMAVAVMVGCVGDGGGKDSVPVGTDSGVTDTDTGPTDSEPTDSGPTDSGPTDSAPPADTDGDGSPDAEDCAVDDNTIYPGATEICDGVDQDCDGEADNGVLSTFYEDADGDGYGVDDVTTTGCEAPAGYAALGGDCKDEVAEVNPAGVETCNLVDDNCDGAIDEGTTGGPWYMDADGDGYGDSALTSDACEAPLGYVATAGDCNDADMLYNPTAAELDCTDPNDYNCDGSVGYVDADGDGEAACVDCDDSNPAVNSSGLEICDSVDNNCDGTVDEGSAIDASSWYMDADQDGSGGMGTFVAACVAPDGYVASSDDCDDTNPSAYPGATELCDSVDNDCNGSVDDGASDSLTFYADSDTDGFGDAFATATGCSAPEGYVADSSDCNDGDMLVSPVAEELCDSVDNNCDGTTDEDSAVDAQIFYLDADGDGYAGNADSVMACVAPPDYWATSLDCDDNDATVSPAGTETCDGAGVDEDCDGAVDDADAEGAAGTTDFYVDADGDNYGAGAGMGFCMMPSGYAANSADCDDAASGINPGATEVCDGADIDENCDGSGDELGASGESTWYTDADSDSFGDASAMIAACDLPAGASANSRDCDDTDAGVNPDAAEVCDAANTDEDCDGASDDADGTATGQSTFYADTDGDLFGDAASTALACDSSAGWVSDATDCDDTRSAVNPAGAEVCDALDLDEDCNGSADDLDAGASGQTVFYTDADGDGFGDATLTASLCDATDGLTDDATDCDDADGEVNPDAVEICNEIDDDCDELLDDADGAGDAYYIDLDGDGFGDVASTPVYSCSGAPAGYRIDGNDCDDTTVLTHPYAYDLSSDTVDSDCDGGTAARVTWSSATTGDDSSTAISPTNFSFPFCGTDYGAGGSSMYMISNGRLTLGSSDTDYTETLAELTSDRAIMPYWDDLYTSISLQLQYAEFDGAMTFAWLAVSECCSTSLTATITAEATLFEDGRILFVYGPHSLSGNDSVVGWACAPASTPSSTNLSAITEAAGYWGAGTGAETSMVELFSTSNPFDLDNSAVRFCGNADGTLEQCSE